MNSFHFALLLFHGRIWLGSPTSLAATPQAPERVDVMRLFFLIRPAALQSIKESETWNLRSFDLTVHHMVSWHYMYSQASGLV